MKTAIKKSVYTTKFASKEENQNRWFVVDAEGKVLGRLASEIAKQIRGKNNPQFTPNTDTGDNVIVLNAEKIVLTGKREDQKVYLRHSGYPGGQKAETFRTMIQKHPERVIELAVKRMLPKTKLGNKLIHKLKVYKGSEHPHAAQNPQTLNL